MWASLLSYIFLLSRSLQHVLACEEAEVFSGLDLALGVGRGVTQTTEVLEDRDTLLVLCGRDRQHDHDGSVANLLGFASRANGACFRVAFNEDDDDVAGGGGGGGDHSTTLRVILSPDDGTRVAMGRDHALLKMDGASLGWLEERARPAFESRVYLASYGAGSTAVDVFEAYFVGRGDDEMTVRKVERWSPHGGCESCLHDIWVRRGDLQGEQIRVGLVDKPPHLIVQDGAMSGFGPDLWRIFQESINASTRWGIAHKT